jgi:iron(III) transport system substrate-binding protein
MFTGDKASLSKEGERMGFLEDGLTRRDALKAGLALGAGVVLGGTEVEQALARAVAKPKKPLLGSNWNAVLAAAKKEGSLNYYTSNADLVDPFQYNFQKAYPSIKVNITATTPAGLTSKVLTEVATGSPTADVIDARDAGIPAYKQASALVPVTLPNDKRLTSDIQDPTGYLHRTYGALVLGYYNTNAVSGTPTQIGDLYELADPSWKNKIGIDDPQNHGPSWNVMASRRILWGDKKWHTWINGLKANNIQVFPSASSVYQAVVTGQIAFGFDSINDYFAQAAGTPANIYFYTEPIVYYFGVSLVNKAPHPNAGLVFMNWMLGTHGQRVFSRSKRFGTAPPKGSLSLAKQLPKGTSLFPLSKMPPYYKATDSFTSLICDYVQC